LDGVIKKEEFVMEELIVMIAIKGSNVMGEPLCEVDGMLFNGRKIMKRIEYRGTVTSAYDVAEAIESMFRE